MTADELLKAINAAGLSPAELTTVLAASKQLIVRESARSEEAAIRAKAAIVAQEYETAAQAAHARFLEADKATHPQA
jgi:hypothetical protein